MTISTKRLNSFIDNLQAAMNRYMETKFPTLDPVGMSFGGGKKYLKIVKIGSCDSVYGFIALCDNPAKGVKEGDILKAAGWKTPALNGARGSIYDDNVISCLSAYGPAYKGCEVNFEVDVSDLIVEG